VKGPTPGATIWLLVISAVVLFTTFNTFDIARDGKDTADELAQLRRESVPVANQRNAALCDIARVLITERQEGQAAAVAQFLEPLRTVDPARFDALRAKGERRTRRLERDRRSLNCAPIPQGP
jgi:hypothetical protein